MIRERDAGDQHELGESLQVIYGDMSPSLARLFVRAPVPSEEGPWRLFGSLRGPESLYAETLPTRFQLVDLGPGRTLLAAATITDPCFWSPEYPMLYELRVELLRGNQPRATARRDIGLRRLGASNRDLVLESRRWVLRGATRQRAATTDLEDWRETSTAMVVEEPSDAFCEEASRRGQLLVVRLDEGSSPERIANQLRRLSAWAAVGCILLPGELPDGLSENPRWAELAPNVLLGRMFSAEAPIDPPAWCQVAFCEVADPAAFAQRTTHVVIPIVAARFQREPAPVAELRRECDTLQRDLAPFGRFAGYVV